ncbi:MAG: biotin/lipoyl-containing protein, partial [Planctomycetota bacterium]|nr:biotin/lipoyl-containing protein [Planctomycetota bacterium]
EPGRILVAGESVGSLLSLGQSRALTVPAGVCGTVRSPRPERVHAPVELGQLLYELLPVEDGSTGQDSTTEAADDGASGLLFRAPQSGRFYQRSAPDAPPLVSSGDQLEAGTVVGLIEVMKTFTQVIYTPDAGLPQRARVRALLVEDGADVESGDALLSLEAN